MRFGFFQKQSVNWQITLEDVEKIMRSGLRRKDKIVLMWLIKTIYYRMDVGTLAFEYLEEVVADPDAYAAIMKIDSMSAGKQRDIDYARLFAELTQGVL